MVVEKYSKNVKNKVRERRTRFCYKNSRSVQVCKRSNFQSSKRNLSNSSQNARKMKRYSRSRFRKKPPVCPGAPHNTTSFLINFHKRDSSADLVGRYGTRETSDPCDRYEVESVMQT